MSKSMGSSLLKLVQERALAKRKLAEQERQRKPYIPSECISNVLVRLPIESLCRLQLVCKAWYNVINDTIFVDDHLSRSETVLIYLSSTPPSVRKSKQLNVFSVEEKLLEMDSVPIFKYPDLSRKPKSYIKYLEIKDGKIKVGDFHVSYLGEIQSVCNGLILISNTMKQGGGLLVMNPVTRSIVSVPRGTLGGGYNELHALAFNPIEEKHKVIHLFPDGSGFSCETITVGIGESWKSVEGPRIKSYMMSISQPVFAIGALNWILDTVPNKSLMSMEIENENFQTTTLPNSGKKYRYDKILEMMGVLCYVAYEGINQVDIWVLKGLCGENFVKHRSIKINTDYKVLDLVPLFGSRICEEIIFRMRKDDGLLYTYNLQMDDMTMVEIPKECPKFFLGRTSFKPHVNSLISWGAMNQFQEF